MKYEIVLNDKPLNWTFGAMKKFERDCKAILKRMDIRPAADHTGYLLSMYSKIAEVMEAAVSAATGLSSAEGKNGEPSEASQAIDAYLQAGGTLSDLQLGMFEAFLEKNDPSSIPPWLEEISRNEEAVKIKQEKEALRLEIARQELENDQRKLEDLKKASGIQSTA